MAIENKPAAGDELAHIPAATEFAPSGAPVQIVPDVDPSHPAVDNDPRAGTSVNQNKIDFNDPTIPGHEAVAKQLTEQGLPTTDVESAKTEQSEARQGDPLDHDGDGKKGGSIPTKPKS